MAPQNSTVLHEHIDLKLDLSPIKYSKTITEDVAEISSLKSSDVYEIIESVKSMNRFSKLTGSQVNYLLFYESLNQSQLLSIFLHTISFISVE